VSTRQQLEKMGATPGKLALMGVLAIVLVMILVKQLPKSAPDSSVAALQPPAVVDQAAKTGRASPVVTTSALTTDALEKSGFPVWPVFHLSKTLTNNPFAPPDWFAPEEPVAIATNTDPGELSELQAQGTSIVVIAEGQKSATIGDQRYRIGDILEGYQVTDITTRGIVLHKLNPR